MVGALAEMSSHVYVIPDLVASLLAAEHCSDYFARIHVEAKWSVQTAPIPLMGPRSASRMGGPLIDRTNELVRPCRGETKRSRHNDLSVEEEDEFEWDHSTRKLPTESYLFYGVPAPRPRWSWKPGDRCTIVRNLFYFRSSLVLFINLFTLPL